MAIEFNFKSQIATTREQSERLIALGLRKETADMAMCYITHDLSGKEIEPEFLGYTSEPMPCEERQTVLCSRQKFIPAWGLHRLIEILDTNPFIFYTNCGYDTVIDHVEEYIRSGFIDTRYLEEWCLNEEE